MTTVTGYLSGTTLGRYLGIFRFVLCPDGRQILFARGTQMRDAFLITNFR